MTATTDFTPEQADAEALAAEQAAEQLAERVRDGDTKVTPQQLADAQSAGVFARLRAEAARRKADKAAARAAEQARQDKVDQALALLAQQASAERLAAAYTAARGAIEAFLAVSDEFDDSVTAAARLLRDAGAPKSGGTPAEMAGPPASPTAPRWNLSFYGDGDVVLGPNDVRVASGAGLRLAVMLDDINTSHRIRRPSSGGPEFVNETVKVQARRARGTLRPALDKLPSAPAA